MGSSYALTPEGRGERFPSVSDSGEIVWASSYSMHEPQRTQGQAAREQRIAGRDQGDLEVMGPCLREATSPIMPSDAFKDVSLVLLHFSFNIFPQGYWRVNCTIKLDFNLWPQMIFVKTLF